jgi:RNase P/RNase MRP subunit p29
MIDPKYLAYHDLIGFKVLVKHRKSKARFTDSGVIIDDTKNLLIVKNDNKTKKFVKKDYQFRVLFEGGILEIDGDKIIGVPENRLRSLKKKKRMR